MEFEGDRLTLDVLNAEWLREKIDSAQVEIEHIRRDDVIVLTARTEDLQAFVTTHVAEAFTGDPITMERIR
jgi:hypothetical protein